MFHFINICLLQLVELQVTVLPTELPRRTLCPEEPTVQPFKSFFWFLYCDDGSVVTAHPLCKALCKQAVKRVPIAHFVQQLTLVQVQAQKTSSS